LNRPRTLQVYTDNIKHLENPRACLQNLKCLKSRHSGPDVTSVLFLHSVRYTCYKLSYTTSLYGSFRDERSSNPVTTGEVSDRSFSKRCKAARRIVQLPDGRPVATRLRIQHIVCRASLISRRFEDNNGTRANAAISPRLTPIKTDYE